MISYPNAKINIGLHIINKREDGFHNIETVFYPIGFVDVLECKVNKYGAPSHKCALIAGGIKVSGDLADNLVVRAYESLNQQFDLPPVVIYLEKRIPTGAGLGGGSSDAAYTLRSLNDLFALKLSDKELMQHAAKLGSDCAFFIENRPAYLFGKGHELQPIDVNLAGYYFMLFKPEFHSNTALAYKHATPRGKLIEKESIKHWITKPIETWKSHLFNDFESSVFSENQEGAKIKEWLYSQGAVYAAMSGSGSSIFGLFQDKPKLKGSTQKYLVHEQYL